MNLCLHQAGKLQCVPIASSVLDILVRLLVRDLKQVLATHQNMQLVVTILLFQINPYVNGALYSLLGNKDINTVAQDMGIENKIIEKCQVRDTDTSGKWSFILLPTAGL